MVFLVRRPIKARGHKNDAFPGKKGEAPHLHNRLVSISPPHIPLCRYDKSHTLSFLVQLHLQYPATDGCSIHCK